MCKLIAVSVALALLASSNALGVIIQGQDFAIGTTNGIHLNQGQQGANSAQDLLIDINQSTDGGGLSIISARVIGVTGQIGGAWGASSLLGTSQLGLNPVLGNGVSLVPGAASTSMLLARARLNSLLLQAP
jgi:hypothetical protein